MSELPVDPIGAAWLAATFQVFPLADFPVLSQIGARRVSQILDSKRIESYPESMRPANEPSAHLQFHLRHEVPHFEFLVRLFAKTGSSFIQEWVNSAPAGQYARKAAFLYEWLTGDVLDVPARLSGRYIDAIDSRKLVAASVNHVVKISRWHINDNLPGNPDFCPMIFKSEQVSQAMDLDIPALFLSLTEEFGEELLQRAAVWMTLRESKASFAIEGESERTSRIERFADVMARRTGNDDVPLSNASLAQLQREILGENTTITHFGIRQSPVFVGEILHYQDIVHYVAPPASDVSSMLEGLRVFLERTEGQSSLMRSAVVAFGFVYIHPMADGNGRIHRFLINDILRRDGCIPEPIILPISALITSDSAERRSYDRVLDKISKPLMQSVREHIAFESTQTKYADGVVSNFVFNGEEQARPVWRYPNLDAHVIYLSTITQRTLSEEMSQQSRYLRNHSRARQALKEIVEMPDHQADRVLRSIEQNRGELSNVLAKEMPILSKTGVWTEIVEAVKSAFDGVEPIDLNVLSRYDPARPVK
ncbi:MAG: Fic family protein [Pelistega sp.]|nr:Fic family protein [Pelistega sp.]